jgi:hypothetical protein
MYFKRMALVALVAAGLIVGTSMGVMAKDPDPSQTFETGWPGKTAKDLKVEGGTIKAGPYETCGDKCAGPSDGDLLGKSLKGRKHRPRPPKLPQ